MSLEFFDGPDRLLQVTSVIEPNSIGFTSETGDLVFLDPSEVRQLRDYLDQFLDENSIGELLITEREQ